ncbi:hypothetical protein RN001_010961 [Aquatica leii]|uniref:Major facilitator superfamily (MFS) profile domain-containing protein n=1 Tax=Aquatica leii TaxID=1421715 RepID=A0AAN7P1Q3_9COLE|nr:hypothetical protein RN001_010961 [Aquatica leii]
MVKSQSSGGSSSEGECPNLSQTVEISDTGYDWTKEQVASILASFFPGYVITHIPGGFLADAYGGKHVLGFGVVISAILSALVPISVELGGYRLLCVNRFLMGLVQGALFPSVTTLLSKWVPKKERSRLAGLVLTGPQVGSILCNFVSGLLISVAGTWKIVYYFWAVVAMVWYFFYLILCFSTPEQHPNITPAEKEELEAEITGHGILFFFIVVNLPKYFKDVLKYNIKENGMLTSLPYAALWISGAISGIIADWCINNNYMTITNVRKLYTTIASIIPSALVVVAGYCGCDRNAASAMFILSMFFKGPFYPGLRVNPLDISKNFAGILSAFVNATGSIAYYPIPYMIAAIAKNNLLAQWTIIFWIIFMLTVLTTIVFDLWASAERAPWDMI